MAKNATSRKRYQSTGLPINDIIAKPLVAIAKAQSMLAKEQLRTLLDTCFTHNGSVYQPVMLKMTVTRSVLAASDTPGESPHLNHITSSFYLPIITIMPLNSLGIEKVNIGFDIEFTSQYIMKEEENTHGANKERTPHQQSLAQKESIELRGRMPRMNVQQGQGLSEVSDSDSRSSFRVNVDAGSLPLAKGLLEIINIYTSAIHLAEVDGNEETLAQLS